MIAALYVLHFGNDLPPAAASLSLSYCGGFPYSDTWEDTSEFPSE